MSLSNFLQDLVCPNPSDYDEWAEVIDRLSVCSGILWYGGSGLDMCPIFGTMFEGLPLQLIDALGQRPLFIYSDYSRGYLNRIENLDDPKHAPNRIFNEIPSGSWTVKAPICRIRFKQRIKLIHRHYVEERVYNFHVRSQKQDDPTLLPWNGYYLKLCLSMDNGQTCRYREADLVWLNTEVLETWHRLFEYYEVKPNCFLTLRTQGRSGSWMRMGDPHGPLLTAISNAAKSELQPEFWSTDDFYDLSKVWSDNELSTWDATNFKGIFSGGRENFGIPRSFQCDWQGMQKYCEQHFPGGLA